MVVVRFYCLPDNLIFNLVITMNQNVTHSYHIAPVYRIMMSLKILRQ
jgi:hypothetical protein